IGVRFGLRCRVDADGQADLRPQDSAKSLDEHGPEALLDLNTCELAGYGDHRSPLDEGDRPRLGEERSLLRTKLGSVERFERRPPRDSEVAVWLVRHISLLMSSLATRTVSGTPPSTSSSTGVDDVTQRRVATPVGPS